MPLSKRTVVRSPTASTTRSRASIAAMGPVELAAAVVGDDHARHTVVHGPPRVVGVQDAFQEDGQPSVLTQVGEVVPGARRVRIERNYWIDLIRRFVFRRRGVDLRAPHGMSRRRSTLR